MYEWRRMTTAQQREVLRIRRQRSHPWHSPPHFDFGLMLSHVTGACYDHKPVIGKTAERIAQCEVDLLNVVRPNVKTLYAWCILPNHYHLLVETNDIANLTWRLGRFHGRFSFQWNTEDGARHRKVWYRCTDRAMRSERHFWVTMNYIHHNPVHHGYVKRWQDWAFSSVRDYLESMGREQASAIWRDYPVRDYGSGWDDPCL